MRRHPTGSFLLYLYVTTCYWWGPTNQNIITMPMPISEFHCGCLHIIVYWHFNSKILIFRNNRRSLMKELNSLTVRSPGADSSPEPISTTFSNWTDKLATASWLQSALPIVVSSHRVVQTTADWLFRRRTGTLNRHETFLTLSGQCRAATLWLNLTKFTALVMSHFAYPPNTRTSLPFRLLRFQL